MFKAPDGIKDQNLILMADIFPVSSTSPTLLPVLFEDNPC